MTDRKPFAINQSATWLNPIPNSQDVTYGNAESTLFWNTVNNAITMTIYRHYMKHTQYRNMITT